MSTIIKTIATEADRSARVVISDENWLEDAAIQQLQQTMTLSCMCCGVGMPDLHPGKGQPIGAAFITRNAIYPHLVGSDIGCGMGVWKLDLPVRKIKLDKLEKRLQGLDDEWQGDVEGYLAKKGLLNNDPLLSLANNKLGTIGGGNHFAEFQQVHQVVDAALFEQSGVDAKSAYLLVHSGSRGLGQTVLRHYVDIHGAAMIDLVKQPEHPYLQQHHYAVRWAEANRALIAQRFCECLGLSAYQDEPLLDITHNMVQPLAVDYAQALALPTSDKLQYWIHRKGASPTDCGLVMIPGSRGSLSYLVKPKVVDHQAASVLVSLAQGGFSLAHGAGRKWKRSDVKGRIERRYSPAQLQRTALGSRVICQQRDLLYEEAPEAYKNIDCVVDDLVQANMIDVVASFKPLLTYKTRRT